MDEISLLGEIMVVSLLGGVVRAMLLPEGMVEKMLLL